MIRSPVDSASPALRALAKPPLGWFSAVNEQVARLCARAMTAGVSSLDPSLTSTTS